MSRREDIESDPVERCAQILEKLRVTLGLEYSFSLDELMGRFKKLSPEEVKRMYARVGELARLDFS